MLQAVSKVAGRAVKGLFDGLLAGLWVGGAVLVILAAALTTAVRAQTVSGALGVDVWQAPEGQVRYLPNYATPRDYKDVGAWAQGKLQHQIAVPSGLLTLSAQGRASEVEGVRVDRLDADLRVTPGAGVRVGVLPYRVSWCRTHEARSPWISEPDAFCRFSGLNEVAQGAFGAQLYGSAMAGSWVIDTMAGVYRPRVDGQNDKLGPYKAVGPTVMHHAHGLSVNALHLPTGIQSRAAWLRTRQDQESNAGSYQRRLRYDTLYAALEGNLTRRMDLRASVSQYAGDQINPALPFRWQGRSTTIEAIYRPAPGHSLAIGVSEYVNRTTYAVPPTTGQIVRVPSVSVAWRFDLADQWHAVLQATRSEDAATTRRGVSSFAQGTAAGLRVAKVF